MTNLRRDADKVAAKGVSKLNTYIKTTQEVLTNVKNYHSGKDKYLAVFPEYCVRVMVDNMEKIKAGFFKIINVYSQNPEWMDQRSFKKHMAIEAKIQKMDRLIDELKKWS